MSAELRDQSSVEAVMDWRYGGPVDHDITAWRSSTTASTSARQRDGLTETAESLNAGSNSPYKHNACLLIYDVINTARDWLINTVVLFTSQIQCGLAVQPNL